MSASHITTRRSLHLSFTPAHLIYLILILSALLSRFQDEHLLRVSASLHPVSIQQLSAAHSGHTHKLDPPEQDTPVYAPPSFVHPTALPPLVIVDADPGAVSVPEAIPALC